jgi:hypothetical protein
MEALTRLVNDSLARHGLDRPVDPRRLQWSRWFLCESPRSLLVVPSKPGIFAIAEEVMDLGTSNAHGGSDAFVRLRDDAPAEPRRMLAVLQFSEDDDMAFTLDRMFTKLNPMRDRLSSGKCFVRFVVIEDPAQRRSICSALNQWMISFAEKASGISSVRTLPSAGSALSAAADATKQPIRNTQPMPPDFTHLDSGVNKNLHCSQPLPSGF